MLIKIDFFDKETEFLDHNKVIELDRNVVISFIQRPKDMRELYCYAFKISDDFKNYILQHNPEMERDFQKYDYSFTGKATPDMIDENNSLLKIKD